MDTNDRHAISSLFDKLAQVEHQMPKRDAEAEHYINAAVARQPGAPYYMAQTVVVQEHALNAAQSRIEALEAALAEARQSVQGGGFLSGLFGPGPAPRQNRRSMQAMPKGPRAGFLPVRGRLQWDLLVECCSPTQSAACLQARLRPVICLQRKSRTLVMKASRMTVICESTVA